MATRHWTELLRGDQLPPVLNLRYLGIGPEGATTLSRVLAQPTRCSQLHTIQLSSNNIGDNGVRMLVEPLKHLNVTSLDLSFNSISNEGAKLLLELPTSMTEVFVIGNDITPSLSEQIFRAVENNRTRLLSGAIPTIPLPALVSTNSASSPLPKETIPTPQPTLVASSAAPLLAEREKENELRRSNSGSRRDKKDKSSGSSTSRSSTTRDKDKKERKSKKSSTRTTSSSTLSAQLGGESPSISNSSADKDPRTREELLQREKELTDQLRRMKDELTERNQQVELLRAQKTSQPSGPTPATATGGRAREMSINLRNISVNEKLSSGGGSNATIFSCYVDGWQCAMKELYIAQMHPDEVKNFEEEIKILESLPFNNNIVRYLFHEKDANKMRLYITRYACSLRDRILDKRRDVEFNNGDVYSVREITKYCLDLSKGLSFLHANAIIHRDLKSDNIFVKLNEQKDISELAIGDFDTAKKVSVSKHAKTLVGTPQYMAPEVLLSNNTDPYTFKADVYSLGMIMYEFLTLKIPYEDENQYNLLTLKMKGSRPRFPTELQGTHQPLIDLYERCTNVNPEQRPDLFAIKEELIRLM